MDYIKQILIAMIATGTLATVAMAAQEIISERRKRQAAEKAIRQQDMIRRDERIKRERIAAAREQLALEYLNGSVKK